MGVKNGNIETAGGEQVCKILFSTSSVSLLKVFFGEAGGGGFSEKQICTEPLARYETMTNAGSLYFSF